MLLNYDYLRLVAYYIFLFLAPGCFMDMPSVSQFGPQLVRTLYLKRELDISEASCAMNKFLRVLLMSSPLQFCVLPQACQIQAYMSFFNFVLLSSSFLFSVTPLGLQNLSSLIRE